MNKKVFSIILIIIGISCLVAGIFCLKNDSSLRRSYANDGHTVQTESNTLNHIDNQKNIPISQNYPLKDNNNSNSNVDDPNTNSIATETPPQVITAVGTDESEKHDDTKSVNEVGTINSDNNHEKGMEFENYIVNRFGKKFWSIYDWRGDKGTNDRFAETSMYPDIEMKLKLKDKEYLVAIECKWRKSTFNKGMVKWSYPDQLKRYQSYASSKNIPVFVAIGLGGSPSDPEHLYLIPLNQLNSHIVYIGSLKPYEVKHDREFYYDIEKQDFRRH